MLSAFILLIINFIVLVWSSEKLVSGAVVLAKLLKVSSLVIGLTIVAIGTSAPEIMVSAIAAYNGNPQLGVGNALGSNIANTAFVIGLTALIKPIVIDNGILKKEGLILLFVSCLAAYMLCDGYLLSYEGVILLLIFCIFGVYLYFSLSKGSSNTLEYDNHGENIIIDKFNILKTFFFIILSLVLLVTSSSFLVDQAVYIAKVLGVSDMLIGLTIVAIGTSLPELVSAVVSAIKGHSDLAVGSIVGSNIFNMLVVLGLPMVISPMQNLDLNSLYRDVFFVIALIIWFLGLGFVFRNKSFQVSRLSGLMLISTYFLYLLLLYRDSNL